MKSVAIIFLIYLVRYAYLQPVGDAITIPTLSMRFSIPCENITSISTIAYNKQNPNGIENVKEQDTCRYIDSSKKVAFTTHGFTSSPNTSFIYELASQLVQKDYTVFSVDWREGSCDENLLNIYLIPAYPKAATNTRKTGELVANYIVHITSKCKVPLDNIMLIGHSLGAHVSGFAAKNVKSRGIGTITRIIGADPAGPNFKSSSCDQRLCNTDAKHVTCFHTTTRWGINKPIGHLNLYFHDASYQPACGFDVIRVCSHSMAIRYLAVLLENSNCGFPGVPQLQKFDESKRPNSASTNCIFVDRKIFDRNNITPGAYTVFVEDKHPFCSQNTFPKCQQ